MATTNVRRLSVYVPTWTFADRLRKARLTTGMTQRAFAAAIDVPYPRYAQWEANNNISRDMVEVVKRVEKISGVSAAWLIGLDGPDEPAHGFRPTNLCLSVRLSAGTARTRGILGTCRPAAHAERLLPLSPVA